MSHAFRPHKRLDDHYEYVVEYRCLKCGGCITHGHGHVTVDLFLRNRLGQIIDCPSRFSRRIGNYQQPNTMTLAEVYDIIRGPR